MKNKRNRQTDPQDARLDELLRLAWTYEDEAKRARLLAGDAPDVDESQAMRLFEEAWRKHQANEKLAAKLHARAKVRQLALRCLRTAAALVAALSLGVTATLAVSEEARSLVLRLLVEIDQEENTAYLRLIRPDLAGMDIPAGWEGFFYPSYLPEGFAWKSYEAKAGDGYAITFTNGKGGVILFEELNGFASSAIDIGEMALSFMEINGDQAFIRREIGGDHIGIDWANDVRWLSVVTDGISFEEAVRIAKGVVYIR